MTAPILTIADEITEELNSTEFSQDFTAERNYVESQRLEKITGLEVWVQPVEQLITAATRGKDQNTYSYELGIFKRCGTVEDVDDMINLSDEIYRHFRRFTFESGGMEVSVESPTLYSPGYLEQAGLFASVIRLTVIDIR